MATNSSALNTLSDTDQQALQGIRHNDPQVIKAIYASHLPTTIKWITARGGSKSEALDVFQDMLLVVFKKANDSSFELTAPLAAYLAGVRHFIWLRRQQKKTTRKEVTIGSDAVFIAEDFIEAKLTEKAKRQLFQRKLLELGKECQTVLRAFFAGKSLREISELMGYTYDYTKKKNSRCKQKLASAVKKDPLYQELKV